MTKIHLSDDAVDGLAKIDVQPLVAGDFQFARIQAHLMQHRGVNVRHVAAIHCGMKTNLIRCAVGRAAFHARAGEPRAEGLRMMIAPRAFRTRRAAELGARVGVASFNTHLDPTLLAELDTYYRDVIAPRAETAEGSKSHRHFFDLNRPEDWSADNILVRFAMQDSVLAAAAAYLQTAPFFQIVKVLESRGIKQDKWESSQLWHLDYADSRAVWLWVYLTDVNTPDDGPYTYLPVEPSKQVNNDFFPRRIRDEEIEETDLKQKVQQVMGPRLTAFLVDSTSIYHMGSRLPLGRRRCIYSASFIDPIHQHTVIKATAPLAGDRRLILAR